MITADDELITPELNGNILPGVTRDSLLTVAPDLGLKPIERPISLEEVTTGITTGAIREWNGATWTTWTNSARPGLILHAASYDRGRNRIEQAPEQ